MLTQTLRSLERAGLVDRAVTPSVPVRVDYSLTPLGHTLLPVVAAMKVWAEGHMGEVHAAQLRYDLANPEAASRPTPGFGRTSPVPRG
jgi:DNA-binding HxlR family transcriptional regulator